MGKAGEKQNYNGQDAVEQRDDEQASTPEPRTGLQGESGFAAIKGEKTLADLAQQFDIHSNQITNEGAAPRRRPGIRAEARPEPAAPAVDLKSLHAKIAS